MQVNGARAAGDGGGYYGVTELRSITLVSAFSAHHTRNEVSVGMPYVKCTLLFCM
jgi:hypothetical protein